MSAKTLLAAVVPLPDKARASFRMNLTRTASGPAPHASVSRLNSCIGASAARYLMRKAIIGKDQRPSEAHNPIKS